MELDSIPQQELEQIEKVGSADLVIGILDGEAQEADAPAVKIAREALADLSIPLRVMVVCNNGAHGQASPESEVPEVSETNQSLKLFSCNLAARNPAETQQQSVAKGYRRVFAIGAKLGVRACGVIALQPPTATRQWIYRLVHPVMDLGFDLVAPSYTRQKMEGLLNRSILAPLQRALYGERLQSPMGPDFGLSGKLLQMLLRPDSSRRGTDSNPLVSIASAAASGGFQVCESHLGVRAQHPTDWGNLSSLLAEVLGATFLEVEARATQWQNIRGSKVLPKFGAGEALPPDSATAPAQNVEVESMIESFHLGTQNLQDLWGLILPPTSLLELRKLSRLPANQFRMPDQLWARIIYDFALAHRQRTIGRDHLLRSITPLYLGWIASYALEMQTAQMTEVDARIENLSKAYEDSKSYLVSRWRWPDRFNP